MKKSIIYRSSGCKSLLFKLEHCNVYVEWGWWLGVGGGGAYFTSPVLLTFVIYVWFMSKLKLTLVINPLNNEIKCFSLQFSPISERTLLFVWFPGFTPTGCPGRNMPDFRRMFLKLKYTDLTKNTYIRS